MGRRRSICEVILLLSLKTIPPKLQCHFQLLRLPGRHPHLEPRACRNSHPQSVPVFSVSSSSTSRNLNWNLNIFKLFLFSKINIDASKIRIGSRIEKILNFSFSSLINMGAFLNCVSLIFEVKISFVNVIYIRSRIRQLM